MIALREQLYPFAELLSVGSEHLLPSDTPRSHPAVNLSFHVKRINSPPSSLPLFLSSLFPAPVLSSFHSLLHSLSKRNQSEITGSDPCLLNAHSNNSRE